MIVGDLLELDGLHIEVAWATPELLDRPVTGVTSTDLQDPARYLQRGELVLSGLVWWQPEDSSAALRFATSLRSAGVAALLAGEGTHGRVPQELADACRTHAIPLLSVPAGTSFRAVTDRVYLRLWGDLQARSGGAAAVPEEVRRELTALLHPSPEPAGDAPAAVGAFLAHATARLGLPACTLATAAGRILARSAAPAAREHGRRHPAAHGAATPAGTGTAGAGTAGRDWHPGGPVAEDGWGQPARQVAVQVGPGGVSPFDGWVLRAEGEASPAVAAVVQGLAELLAPSATRARATAAAQRQTAVRLVELLAQGGGPGLADAVLACGLPEGRLLTPVAVRLDGGPASWAVSALAEALHGAGAPFAAAPDGRGGATGLTAATPAAAAAALRSAWPAVQGLLSGRQALRAGVGPAAAPEAGPLRGALVQAGYALEANRAGGAVGSAAELGSLADLLAGIPSEVTEAFHGRLLAPLADHDRANAVSLLGTLESFLEHDCSWSRTAEALHVHVNTVHYRVRRIEELTGRSVARLADRLDLRAALLCAPRRT